ncbi:DUF7504 family protein [Haloplanus halobius]|uniref:DUF7504 family protein n=1 Tax=Haloplanus halobius TaxID=2934938 RepID=UPI00200E8C07|nr:hypothetical protein [Haloplanus sp. XH21]
MATALPVRTLHLTDGETAIHAQQCVHAAPASDASALIVVAFAGSPVRWLDQWRAAADTDPDRVTVVLVDAASWLNGDPGERLRAVAHPDADVRVETVASPGNLTDIGVTLTEVLDAHEEEEPHLCFQSVTVLLQYASAKEVCQFLHVLGGHLDQFGATGHFHLHEGAHDEETVEMLRSVHDRIRHDPS